MKKGIRIGILVCLLGILLLLGSKRNESVEAKELWGPVQLERAVSISYNQIQIRWKSLPGAKEYRIYRMRENGKWQLLETVNGKVTSYTDTKRITGKEYVYKVRAVKEEAGVLILSAYSEKTVTGKAKPAKVELISAKIKQKGIEIKWEKTAGATGYRILRKEESQAWKECKVLKTIKDGTVTSYKDTTAEYGKKYIYTVRAYTKNEVGTTWGTYDTTGVTRIMKPIAPTLKELTPVSKTQMKIEWSRVSEADGYCIYRKNEAGNWKRIKTIQSGGTTAWTDTSLTYGNTYTYTVKAYWDRSKGGKQEGYYNAKGITEKLSYKAKYKNGLKFYYDAEGELIKNVDKIIGRQKEYVIKVNKQCNVVTIYAKDGNKGFTIPVKACITSTGTGTPLGTFYTPIKYRWRALYGDVFGQWSTRIYNAILFHSTYYYVEGDNTSLSVECYNQLGTTASKGCCRLICEDAKWIYDNCDLNTKVIIYESQDPGPFGKPKAYKLEKWHTWDPTDPNARKLCVEKDCH